MNGMKVYKRKITFKSFVTSALILIALADLIGLMGYRLFTRENMDQFETGGYRIARAAANVIDADRLDEWLESGGAGDDYQTALKRLDALCNASDATFIYVIRPDPSDYSRHTYIFSTVNRERSMYSPYEVGTVMESSTDAYLSLYRDLCTGASTQEALVLDDPRYGRETAHITAMIPLTGSDGAVKALMCVQRQMDEVFRVRRVFLRESATITILILLVDLIILSWFLRSSLLRPLEKITDEASRFAKENSPAQEKLADRIRNTDEIGILAAAIDSMEERTAAYVTELTAATAEKERGKTELSLAARIQSAVLPQQFPAFPDRNEFDVYAVMDPAKEVGGDFYDFFLIDDDHLCLSIADVSGKGIPAALFMMASRIILRDQVMSGSSPAQILFRTNNRICENNPNKMFVTVWLGILEISTGRLTASSAGHEYPAVKDAAGQFAILKDKHGFVLGGMNNMKYTDYELWLEPGARIFVYTDGVPEASDCENRMFGTERMLAALNEDPDGSPEEILGNVRTAVDGFVKDAEQFDDLTMLCLEYRGASITQTT